MQRRQFLKLSGCFITYVSGLQFNTGCSSDQEDVLAHFPQGVSSGDPGPTSVMLWTRAEPVENTASPVKIKLQFALDENFDQLFFERDYTANSNSDYTLRILIDGLGSDTIYFYRFISDTNFSITGRTRTAPDPQSTQTVKLAFMSCQERKHGFYNAYRSLINDDIVASADEQIQFVLHLGDFIYETRNDPLQTPVDENLQAIELGLTDLDGQERNINQFIDGSITTDGIEYAQTLADYRQLYKQYLSDPDLQAARARWPFVPVWDDHEFSDDCWQTEANYEDSGPDSSTNEPSQPRKVAANQAWFEYMPVNLTRPENTDEDLIHSQDFEFIEVTESTNDQINQFNQVINEDNLNAIASLTIYRSLQYGAMLQLILTDNRSYRSDHAIPEDLTGNIDLFFSPRVALPLELQNDLDAGITANNGDPDTFLFLGSFILNPRRFSPPGTMLGSKQKDWFKQNLQRSTSRWKIWANSVPLMRLLLNLSALENNLEDVLISVDSWDGYNSERKELLQFLLDQNIQNVVSLSGDLHAHFAGEVWNDFDDSNNQVAMVEAVCGAVSSISQFKAVENLTRIVQPTTLESQIRELITYDSSLSSSPGTNAFVNNLNNSLLNGIKSAQVATATNDLEQIEMNKDEMVNQHLVYADTDAHGYGIATLETAQMTVELITINNVNQQSAIAAQKKRSTKFVIPWTDNGQQASISSPTFTGPPPFPFAIE